MYKTTNLRECRALSVTQDSNVLSLRLGDVAWLLLFNLLAFQIYFQEEFGGIFSYIDEFASIAVMLATVVSAARASRRNPVAARGLAAPVLLLGAAITMGLVSNMASGICTETFPVLVDAFTFCKVPIVLLCCLALPRIPDSGGRAFWRLLVLESQGLIAVMVACAVMNLLPGGGVLGMGGETRYGISSFRFVFYHPEVVNLMTVGLIVILLADDPKGHRAAVAAALLVMCATLRWKAIGFAAVVFFVLFLRRGGRVSAMQVVLGLLAAVLVAWGQISTYYDNDSTARSILTENSLDIAINFAPFGSGFATFGSAITSSGEYYSPLYYQYGYESIYGLSPLNPSYVSDTFWPTIVAQLGFVGTVIYAVGGVLVLARVYNRFREGRIGIPVTLAIIYLAICSTSSSALFAPQWVYIAVILYFCAKHIVVDVSTIPYEHAKGIERNGLRMEKPRVQRLPNRGVTG